MNMKNSENVIIDPLGDKELVDFLYQELGIDPKTVTNEKLQKALKKHLNAE